MASAKRWFRRATAAYYGMTTCLDAMIGEILSELDAANLSENTYVIYTSDHGESLGEHGLFYKYNPYEGSAGIPLIIAIREIIEGTSGTRH